MKELQPGRVRLVEDQELQTRQVKNYKKYYIQGRSRIIKKILQTRQVKNYKTYYRQGRSKIIKRITDKAGQEL